MPDSQQTEWFDRSSLPPRLGRPAVVAFLALIISVPGVQLLVEVAGPKPVQELDVFRQFPRLESLQAFERALERVSVVAEAVRPWTQWAMTRLTRRGNEKVIVGRRGWGFYRPSVRHVTGPGFLATTGRARPAAGSPLGAIIHFRDQLSEHGIDLLLLPMPSKETVCPQQLVDGYRHAAPPENVDTGRLQAELEREGVSSYDPARVLRRAGETGPPPYLPLDTHWTPAGMDLIARALAAQLGRSVYTEGARRRRFRTETRAVANRGDLYDMLALPSPVPAFPPTRVTLARVVDDATGEPVEPDPQSPILLLGDSFTNIYSDPQLHWGDHAGLAEHLALHLGLGVDVIAQNDGGVNGCRQQLARRPGMLSGKHLVIWQFATRDFTLKAGGWKRIPLRLRTTQQEPMV